MTALPHVIRDELSESIIRQQTSITWEELTQEQKQKLWDRYNSALLLAHQKNKLGVVVFQVMLYIVKLVFNMQTDLQNGQIPFFSVTTRR